MAKPSPKSLIQCLRLAWSLREGILAQRQEESAAYWLLLYGSPVTQSALLLNEVTFSSLVISELDQALLKWEQVYDTIRPHQALGYLTPQQFLTRHQQNQKKEVSCH